MSEIKKLTPQLLSAAEMSASQGGAEGTAGAEHLKLLSQEWATKVTEEGWEGGRRGG